MALIRRTLLAAVLAIGLCIGSAALTTSQAHAATNCSGPGTPTGCVWHWVGDFSTQYACAQAARLIVENDPTVKTNCKYIEPGKYELWVCSPAPSAATADPARLTVASPGTRGAAAPQPAAAVPAGCSAH